MNILEIEDMIKGLPVKPWKPSTDHRPGAQFLVVPRYSEGDMRKRFSERRPQGTVKDQYTRRYCCDGTTRATDAISYDGRSSLCLSYAFSNANAAIQMAPPMQMAEGRVTPFPDDPRLAELRAQGLTDEQIAQEIRRLGLNESRMAQLGLPTFETMEATMQPDAYSQDAYADIFARQQGNIPAGMEFIGPRTTDDLLYPQLVFTTKEMAQSQTLPVSRLYIWPCLA